MFSERSTIFAVSRAGEMRRCFSDAKVRVQAKRVVLFGCKILRAGETWQTNVH